MNSFAYRRFRQGSARIGLCEKRLHQRFGGCHALFKSILRRKVRELAFQLKQPVAVSLPGQSKAVLACFLCHNLQCLIELSTQMGPAAHHNNVFRQPVVALIAIGVKITAEMIQELRRMLGLTVWLVLIQNNRLIGIPACPVQLHVALGLRCFARLAEHLQRRLVRVHHLLLQQQSFHSLIDRLKPVLRTAKQPV